MEFYTDKDSMFTVNRPQAHTEDEAWEEELTQIGRALRELGMGWIPAHSPQAKGRIERFFGTAQDRRVKGMRKAGVRTGEEANAYLEQEYLPLWNRRFTQEPAHATDPAERDRPLGREHDLAAILSHVESRVVANDYTMRYQKKLYQMARADPAMRDPGWRGARVRVEERRDGRVWVRFRDRYVTVSVCEPRPQPAAPRPAPNWPLAARRHSTWMKGFDLQQSPPLWQILRQEQGDVDQGRRAP